MLLPKHCSNPTCHRPYVGMNGRDVYSDVLVKLDSENTIRVISVCTTCRMVYNEKMAQAILKDVMPVEIKQIENDPLLTRFEKLAKIQSLTKYSIVAVGRDVDEIRKKL